MIDFISQPWHWAVSGVMIVFVMFILHWFGNRFGVSSNLNTICAMGGAGKNIEYFNFDWKEKRWNLVFIFGAIIGGYIAINFLASPEPVQISEATRAHFESLGVHTPRTLSEGNGYVPAEIFATANIFSLKNLIMLVLGGFLVGFGARYAGGCTSGHAISGLSNLQLPSLISVIGFFIGGLFMAWIVLPQILTL